MEILTKRFGVTEQDGIFNFSKATGGTLNTPNTKSENTTTKL
jgi:hypothetical protein